jgi:hypothetical protein
MKILEHTDTLFNEADAENLAYTLNADAEDDWTYRVAASPFFANFYVVEVYDEVGEHVGNL